MLLVEFMVAALKGRESHPVTVDIDELLCLEPYIADGKEYSLLVIKGMAAAQVVETTYSETYLKINDAFSRRDKGEHQPHRAIQ